MIKWNKVLFTIYLLISFSHSNQMKRKPTTNKTLTVYTQITLNIITQVRISETMIQSWSAFGCLVSSRTGSWLLLLHGSGRLLCVAVHAFEQTVELVCFTDRAELDAKRWQLDIKHLLMKHPHLSFTFVSTNMMLCNVARPIRPHRSLFQINPDFEAI